MLKVRLLALLSTILPTAALATNVIGTLPANTTWTPAGNPWVLTGDVTVPAGVTLTIEPGVQVTFASSDGLGSGVDTARVELIVDGTLDVQGTSASPVTLTASNAFGTRVQGTANFNNAILDGGLECLRVSSGILSFNNSTLQNCTRALNALGGTSNLNYSLVRSSGSSFSGIYAITLAANANLIHNTITGNPYGGIRVSNFTGTVNIYDNIITSNGSYGVNFSSSTAPTRSVHHNDVWSHSSADYTNVSPGAGSISANPLFISATNLRITEYSPARLMASDGTDIGALQYAGDPSSSLQGALVANTTLSGANTLAGDLIVRPGVTLTLAQGASLTFASSDGQGSGVDTARVELIVDGTLDVQGTSASPVTLTASNAFGTRVQGTANFNNALLDGGLECLRVSSGTLSFNNSTLQNCTRALNAQGGTSNLNYSLVRSSGSSFSGIYAISLAADANLIHNTITGNPYGGIRVSSFTGNVNIYDNIITSNGSYGVNFSSAVSTSPSRSVHHNDVWSHSSADYTNVSAGAGSISANPLFISSSNLRITEYSPARLMASDGTDIGALQYAGDPSSSLQGALVSNTTLTGANTLAGDLIVRPGVTLTLAQGASLTFASSDGQGSGVDTARVELIVDGTLDVQGTSASPVTLTASSAFGTRVQGTANFNNAILDGGLECLRVSSGTLSFNNSTLQNCTRALNALGGTSNLNYSLVRSSGSSFSGIYAITLAANANLIHNTITGNPYGGIRVSSFTGTVNIYDNIITSNGSYGVNFSSAVSTSPSRSVHHNDVWSHSSADYTNVSPGAGSISANPLFVSSSNLRITEYSPARLMASDGTDIGALQYAGDPSSSLQGALVANTTLSGANTLAGDLIVRPGVTLTLAQGASLTFASSDGQGSGVDTARVELIVDGTLDVQGTSASPVTLTASNAFGTRVQGTANFSNALLDGGLECLRVSSGTLSFNNSTLQNCTRALNALGGTSNLNYSLVRSSGSSFSGIYAISLAANANLIHNTITGNPYGGIRVSSFTGNVNIYDNIITSNGSYGVNFSSAVSTSPGRSVHHNDVWSHSSADYTNVSAGTGSISANPLFVSSSNLRITEYSPARLMASDGTDIGALQYAGDPSSSLQGALVSNTTLTGANTLAGDLIVRPGVTLTLAQGASLTFASSDAQGSGVDTARVELIVDGTLNAQGTSASPVTLTASSAFGTRVQGTANFNNAILDGGLECLRVSSGILSFNNSTLQNCTRALNALGGTSNLNYSLVRSSGSSFSGIYAITLAANANLIHNTITGNPYGGIRVSNFTGTVNIYDNIITSNGSYGVNFSSSTAPTRSVHHNDVWSHSSADHTNVSPGTGSISANPLFVSATNFTLQETSPCRNIASDGTDLGAFPYVPVTAAYVVVTPTPHTMTVQGTQQFTATAYDSANNPLPRTFTWTADPAAGSVNSSGLFTAGCTPGTYTTAVTATADGRSASANVTINPGTVSTVTVSPSSATVPINGTQQFTATARDACNNSLPSAPISWVITNGGGSLNSSGLFTAGTTPGTFTNTVRATSGTAFGSATVTVTGGALASIEVSPNTATLPINGTQQFTAIGRDSAGNTVPVTVSWSVVSGGGAINSSGLFTAGTTPGTFTNTIRATSGAISGFATVTVQPGLLASIEVSPSSATLPINDTQQFTATGRDSAGNTVPVTVSWSVVNGGGTINSSGLFTAGTSPGTFTNTIRATSGTLSGFASVTVQPGALASIEVSPGSATLGINGTQQFTAIGRDSAGNTVPVTVSWSVVNDGGAINSSGLFTAGTTLGTFTNTIRASSGTLSGFATVTVQAGALASIEVSPSSASLPINGTQQFTATGRDSAGNTVPVTVSWSVVSDGGTINSSGLFTAGTTPGTFTNTIRASSGTLSGFASVTVQPGALASIEVSPSSTTLPVNGTQQFTATGRDSAGNTVPITASWSVVNGGGVINSSGLFTAGTVAGTFAQTIRASSGTLSATASVTVNPGPAQTVAVAPASVTLPVRGAQQFTATATDAWGNTVPGTPSWSVSPAAVGTIDSSGAFTAGNTAGTYPAAVTATLSGVSGSADVTLTASTLARIVVTPATLNLEPRGTRQFSAQGQDADGNVVPITPVWSVVNGAGSITQDGLFTATQVPGIYADSVVATADGLTGTASVTVVPGGIQRVVISPQNPTVAVQGTLTFTAKAFDAFDNELSGLTPTWEVINGGGTINASGVFTAGTTSGRFADTVKVILGGMIATTSVTIATDFDGDGIPDAWEIANGLDPSQPGDASLDPDGDTLSNLSEFQVGANPRDADTDDDGALDGREQRPGENADSDTLVNVLDPDSDNDGLFDGTEMAVTSPHANTDTSKRFFVADTDPATSTDPLTPDTDGDGRKDGEEDANHNGKVDPGETDPNHPDMFCSATPQCGPGQVCQDGVCVDDPGGPGDGDGNGGGCGCSGSGAGVSLLGLLLLSLIGRIGDRRRRG